MLTISRALLDEMVAHCIKGLPDEACGLLGGAAPLSRVDRLYPTGNEAASALVYTIPPIEFLRADRDAEQRGIEILGVFHSHTHTEAYPSPTDVGQAPDPSWHYVIVSLRDTIPAVRSYRIVDGQVTEEQVDISGDAGI